MSPLRATALLAAAAAAAAAPLRVQHIVYIMMENHAFDNMLGWLPGVDGVNASGRCNTFEGQTFCATDRGAYSDPDPDHSVTGTAQQIFGAAAFAPGQEHNASAEVMSGFIDSYMAAHKDASLAPTIMDCFTPSAVPVISTLAQQFTVIDTYHASVPACTFPNRLFALSATSAGYADNDDVMTALGWPQESIFARLSAAGADWRVYFTDVPSALLMRDARNVSDVSRYRGIADFAKDAAAGDLPFFTFVEPGFLALPGQPETDQHPAADVADGERWIKAAYEALRASPLWNSSAMLLTYDEHGGFYDHIAPLNEGVPSPDGVHCVDCAGTTFNFTRLGIRVPMVVVSPWADKGRIVHAPATAAGAYEHSSLAASLAAIVPGFGAPLTARAAWAAPLHPLWEQTARSAPRTDCPATLPAPPQQTPSQAGLPHDGSGPASHLQRLMLQLAEGAAARGGMTVEEAAARPARLEAEGAFSTGAAAAERAAQRLREAFTVAPVAAAAPASPASCSAKDAECVLASARGTPAWQKHFEEAADGPEQFHVAYGATPDAVSVRWATSSAAATATVAWGTSAGALSHTAVGKTDRYIYGPKYTSPWLHTTNLTGLPLGTRIFYQCGDAATGLSAVMSFMSNPGVGAVYPFRTAFVADIGEADSANQTVTRVLEATALGLVDSVVINGDISYATGCESQGCTTWDAYCRMASPLAATVPWMISIGNHEEGDDANGIYAISSTYRFAGMPTGGRVDDGTGLQYFSWEAGPVHYISLNSFYVVYLAGTRVSAPRLAPADCAVPPHTAAPL